MFTLPLSIACVHFASTDGERHTAHTDADHRAGKPRHGQRPDDVRTAADAAGLPGAERTSVPLAADSRHQTEQQSARPAGRRQRPGSQRQCSAFPPPFCPGSQRQCSTFLPFALVHNVSAPPFFPLPWFTTSALHLSSLCPGSQRQCSAFLPFALVQNVSAPPFFPLPWFTTSVLHLSSLCPGSQRQCSTFLPGSQRQCSTFLPGSQRQCSTFLPLALVHNVSAPPFFPLPWFTTSVLHLSSLCPGSQRQCSTFLPLALVHNVSAPPFFLVHNVSAPPFFPWPWFTTSVLHLSSLGPGSKRQCSTFLPLALVHNVSAPPFFPLPWFPTSMLHLSSWFPTSVLHLSSLGPGSQRQCSTFLPLALVPNVSAPPFFPWPWFPASVLHLSSLGPALVSMLWVGVGT